MQTITVDSSTGSQLNQFKVPVILVDQAGRRLGKFVPESVSWRDSYKDDGCPHSLEELEEISKATEGMTLPDFWKSVGRA